MTLKELSTAVWEAQCKQYPNVPPHAVPKKAFTDKTANGLTNAILEYFKLKGVKAWRQRSEGRYLPGAEITNVLGQRITTRKGKFIPLGKAGGKFSADITGVWPPHGKRMEIEVKIGKDRQSEGQKNFQKEIENAGGIYFIVRTWDDFIYNINKC